MLNKTNIVVMTGLSEVNYDQITELIPRVESYLKDQCNVKELNPALEMAGALMIEYIIENSCKSNIASESISDIGSISYNTDFPQNIKDVINFYKRTKYTIGG